MGDVVIILEKLEGIIGALLGVALTLILTQIFKSWGRFNFYINKSEVIFEKLVDRDFDQYSPLENNEDADRVNINLVLEIYNSSDSPKILRDARFSFYHNKKMITSFTPEDVSTEKFAANSYRREEFVNVNVKPKEITIIKLIKILGRQEVALANKCNRVYFEIKDSKNKNHRVLLAEI